MLVSHSINPENLVTIAQILRKILKLSHSNHFLSDICKHLTEYNSPPGCLEVDGEQVVNNGHNKSKPFSLTYCSLLSLVNIVDKPDNYFNMGINHWNWLVLWATKIWHGWCSDLVNVFTRSKFWSCWCFHTVDVWGAAENVACLSNLCFN